MSLSGVGRHWRMNRPSRRSTFFCGVLGDESARSSPLYPVRIRSRGLSLALAGRVCVCGAAYERSREMTGHVGCSAGPLEVSVDASRDNNQSYGTIVQSPQGYGT